MITLQLEVKMPYFVRTFSLMKVSSKSQINHSHPNPRRMVKINFLKFLVSHFFVVPARHRNKVLNYNFS